MSAQDLASALISVFESIPMAATNDVTFDVLVAEDNLVNQRLTVKILEKFGHTVEVAENGSLAVDAFKARAEQNRPFDIILVRLFRPRSALYSAKNPIFSRLMAGTRWISLCRLWAVWRRQS